jgi:sulfide:quinone oxidoreductase
VPARRRKALYLSADHWFKVRRNSRQHRHRILQCRRRAVRRQGLRAQRFSEYIEKYNARLSFMHNLVKIDGPARKAWFALSPDADGGNKELVIEKSFDMIHVVPPQIAPDFHSGSARLPMPQAGWMSIRQRSGTRHLKTSGRSAM